MLRQLILCQLTVLSVWQSSHAATGEVSFSITDTTALREANAQQPTDTTVDVFVHVEGLPNLTATTWSMFLSVTPLPGAAGTVEFAPPPLVAGIPNLLPSSSFPFEDFDRDFGGMSSGTLGDSSAIMIALASYLPPLVATPPPLDTNGNLTVPTGSGLVALPLAISPDAVGDFLVSFDPNPALTGVAFATGLPDPGGTALHPAGTHQNGILRVRIPLPADFDRDADVDGDDFLTWQQNFGLASGATVADGDADNDGDVDGDDFLLWQQDFNESVGGSAASHAVPEATTWILLVVTAMSAALRRQKSAFIND